MKERNSFPACDGHIESILIGYRMVKVSFQTWDAKKLVLIYNDVERMEEQNSVFGDISEYTANETEDGWMEYSFFDEEDQVVLKILAKSIKILETGNNAGINCALFDVGSDYIGNQDLKEYP